MKLKSEAAQIFLKFKALVENQFQTKIKNLQTDWGGEFRPFLHLSTHFGINFQHPCPHTHNQNGKIEKKHRHIIETALSLLAHSFLPQKFWWHACATASFLINPYKSFEFQITRSKIVQKEF